MGHVSVLTLKEGYIRGRIDSHFLRKLRQLLNSTQRKNTQSNYS